MQMPTTAPKGKLKRSKAVTRGKLKRAMKKVVAVKAKGETKASEKQAGAKPTLVTHKKKVKTLASAHKDNPKKKTGSGDGLPLDPGTKEE